METPYIYKIVIIGDSNCGKSNIITRYTQDIFNENSQPTIGVEFFQKDLQVPNASKNLDDVKLQIWDTAGQERFRGMAGSYYRKGAGVLLVYDITNKTSFQNLKKWLNEIKSYAEPMTDIILLGNKKDLNEEREVKLEQGQEFAEENKLYFYEVSAKNNENKLIDKVFYELAKRIHENEQWRSDTQTETLSAQNGEVKAPSINLENKKPKKEEGCCN